MRRFLIPACCLVLLGAFLALVAGHWIQLTLVPAWVVQFPRPQTAPVAPASQAPAPAVPLQSASPDAGRELAELRKRVESLEASQQRLQQLLAETNRDVLTLQFRVDTHSESFRPMPVAESNQAAPVAVPIFEPAADSPARPADDADDATLLPARALPVNQGGAPR